MTGDAVVLSDFALRSELLYIDVRTLSRPPVGFDDFPLVPCVSGAFLEPSDVIAIGVFRFAVDGLARRTLGWPEALVSVFLSVQSVFPFVHELCATRGPKAPEVELAGLTSFACTKLGRVAGAPVGIGPLPALRLANCS